MGKGFNNYMCKKFFHPASRDNLKRVWMAEQKTEAYKKKQEELRVQYEKEQDLYNNKALLWKDSKEKLTLNFMYEPPPGLVKEKTKDDLEEKEDTKFEWQRKFNAPREDYCKGDTEIRDQPFGIRVRNVRCIKCHNWGHLNTDKECPLFNKSAEDFDTATATRTDPTELAKQMAEEGLLLKKSITSEQRQNNNVMNIGKGAWSRGYEKEIEFLKKLDADEQLKILKALKKLVKKKEKGADVKKKLKKVMKSSK